MGKCVHQPLPSWKIFLYSIPIIPSQVGWAVSESLLMPYFVSLGIRESIAQIVWLITPVLSFFVQPIIGSWSDHCNFSWGRRKPFSLAFHLGSAIGLMCLCFAEPIMSFFSGGPVINSEHQGSLGFVLFLFLMAAFMDINHELLTIPTRAALNDNLTEDQINSGNGAYAVMTSLGAVIGLLLVVVPVQAIMPIPFLQSQLHSAFFLASAIAILSGLLEVFLPEDAHALEHDTGGGEEEKQGNQQETCKEKATSEGSEESEIGLREMIRLFQTIPRALLAVWVVEFFWWFVTMQPSFWWTTWVGKEVYHADPVTQHQRFEEGVQWGTVGFLVQACTALLSSIVISPVNEWLGVTNVFHAGSTVFAAGLAMMFWFRSKWASMAYMAVSGFAFPIISTNPYILIEVYTEDSHQGTAVESEQGESPQEYQSFGTSDTRESDQTSQTQQQGNQDNSRGKQVDEEGEGKGEEEEEVSNRGLLIALMNIAMPAGQVAAAGLSGILIQLFGSISLTFLVCGCVSLVVNVLVFFFGWSYPTPETVRARTRPPPLARSAPTSPATSPAPVSLPTPTAYLLPASTPMAAAAAAEGRRRELRPVLAASASASATAAAGQKQQPERKAVVVIHGGDEHEPPSPREEPPLILLELEKKRQRPAAKTEALVVVSGGRAKRPLQRVIQKYAGRRGLTGFDRSEAVARERERIQRQRGEMRQRTNLDAERKRLLGGHRRGEPQQTKTLQAGSSNSSRSSNSTGVSGTLAISVPQPV